MLAGPLTDSLAFELQREKAVSPLPSFRAAVAPGCRPIPAVALRAHGPHSADELRAPSDGQTGSGATFVHSGPPSHASRHTRAESEILG
eukprot:scaffold1911_cov397-Prasinococcus_capsulatus_cf.AAC.22